LLKNSIKTHQGDLMSLKKKNVVETILQIINVKIQDLNVVNKCSARNNISFNRRKLGYTNLYKELEILINIHQMFNHFSQLQRPLSFSLFYNQYILQEFDNSCFNLRFFF
jgi:hypothetical protein